MKNEIDKDLLDIINNSKFLTLSTTNCDGSPHASPIARYYFDGKNVVFDNGQGSRHAENLRRDNRCYVTIIHCDKERLHALYLWSVAKEFPNEKRKEAEKIFEELGKETPDNLFYAPLGKIENQGLRNGAKRFWYIYKEEVK